MITVSSLKSIINFPANTNPIPPPPLAIGSQGTSKYLATFLQNLFPAFQMMPVLHHVLRFRRQTRNFHIRKLRHCQRREDLFEVADQMALYHLYWHDIYEHFEGDLWVRVWGVSYLLSNVQPHGQRYSSLEERSWKVDVYLIVGKKTIQSIVTWMFVHVFGNPLAAKPLQQSFI